MTTERSASEIAAEFDQVAAGLRKRLAMRKAATRQGISPDEVERLLSQLDRSSKMIAVVDQAAWRVDCLQAVANLEIVRAGAWNAQRLAVGLARQGGSTWAEIGDLLGISRQAAQQRFATDSRP